MNFIRGQAPIARLVRDGLRGSTSMTYIPSLNHGLGALLGHPNRGLYTTRNASDSLVHRSSHSPVRTSISGIRCSSLRGQRSYSIKAAAEEPTVHNIFEPVTGTWQYIVADASTSTAVIIDPVLDYEPSTQGITTKSADALLAFVQEKSYRIEKILETHAHADHLTAASYLQKRLAEIQDFKPPIGIGKRIEQVQTLFGKRYGLAKDEYSSVFDELFDDDETFTVGNMTVKALHVPGHTPDHIAYQTGDNVFCGDSLFHADIGTARCDFPGGDATQLFSSGRRLLALEANVKIWPGHDYPPEGRDPVPWMSVGDHKRLNKHLADEITQEQFVKLRTERDANLKAPRLLHPSLQINIRGGRLPRSTESGHRMLHLPLKLDGLDW